MAQQVSAPQLADAQLQALGNLCTCRANAECRALMGQLALRGLLPVKLVTMSDQEWAAACKLATSASLGSPH